MPNQHLIIWDSLIQTIISILKLEKMLIGDRCVAHVERVHSEINIVDLVVGDIVIKNYYPKQCIRK